VSAARMLWTAGLCKRDILKDPNCRDRLIYVIIALCAVNHASDAAFDTFPAQASSHSASCMRIDGCMAKV
jgi:hypothetical protein